MYLVKFENKQPVRSTEPMPLFIQWRVNQLPVNNRSDEPNRLDVHFGYVRCHCLFSLWRVNQCPGTYIGSLTLSDVHRFHHTLS
jgi:hypothetical protein